MATTKNEKQKDSSRARILDAAVPLFASKGYGNTGLREIATAADVNLAMINYFFGSKKKLLKEILDIFFAGYLEIARNELTGDEEFQIKIERFIHKAVRYFASCTDYLLVTISELPHDDPEILEHKAKWGRQMIEIVENNLSNNRDSRIHSPVQPVFLCSILISMMASRFLFTPLMQQVKPGIITETSVSDYAEIICSFFLHGITGK